MNTKLSLFDGITPEEYNRMMVCFQASEKSFSTDETVCFYADHPTASAIFWKEKPPSSAHTWTAARPFWNTWKPEMSSARHFPPVTKRRFFAGDLHQKLQDPVYRLCPSDQTLPKCLQFPQSFSQQCSSADFQKSDRPWRTSGNPLAENNKRKTPVLFRKTCTGAAFRQLYAALFFKYACRLSFRWPQCHDAGTEKIKGGGNCKIRTQNVYLSRISSKLNRIIYPVLPSSPEKCT